MFTAMYSGWLGRDMCGGTTNSPSSEAEHSKRCWCVSGDGSSRRSSRISTCSITPLAVCGYHLSVTGGCWQVMRNLCCTARLCLALPASSTLRSTFEAPAPPGAAEPLLPLCSTASSCLLTPPSFSSCSRVATAAEARPPGTMPVLAAIAAMFCDTLKRPVEFSVELSADDSVVLAIARSGGSEPLSAAARCRGWVRRAGALRHERSRQ